MTARVRPQSRTDASWWNSLVFLVAIVLIAGTLIVEPRGNSASRTQAITYRVVSADNGKALEGVTVTLGGQSLLTDANGEVHMPVAEVDQDLVVRMNGFEPVNGVGGPKSPGRQQILLSNATGDSANLTQPVLPAATPIISDPNTTADAIATTAVPTATATREPTKTATPAPLAPGEAFAGKIIDPDGNPINGAMIRVGERWVLTDQHGRFTFDDWGDAKHAIVSASGYADAQVPISSKPVITLDKLMIKGVYLNGTAAGMDDVVNNVIRLIDDTELNAVVVDIKDGVIYYDSQIEFFQKANAVRPTYDAKALLEKFHEHGIYVIARDVAFKDPLVAAAYPKLAVTDETTGKLWTGWSGEPWVNPLEKGLYQPNVDLAAEAGGLGFDEIQYDYIRFPDGDLKGADFGPNYNDMNKRIAALTTILKMTHTALRPLGVKLSADVFGWMLLVDDDQGIGQRFPDIAAVVDYISPMVYPSHFPTGSLAVDGAPNNHPYETIEISMGLGMQKIPGMELKMRPWLQDFTLPDMKVYTAEDIRAEIDAAEDTGSGGWLVWNVDADYVDGAYRAADS